MKKAQLKKETEVERYQRVAHLAYLSLRGYRKDIRVRITARQVIRALKVDEPTAMKFAELVDKTRNNRSLQRRGVDAIIMRVARLWMESLSAPAEATLAPTTETPIQPKVVAAPEWIENLHATGLFDERGNFIGNGVGGVQ